MDNLPKEVTLDILSRLPVESVLDCKLVCKAWRDSLQFRADNFFADLHLQSQHGLQLMQPQEQHKQFLGHESIHDFPNAEPMSFFGVDRHAFYYAEYHTGGEIIDEKQPNYQAKRMNLKFPDAVHGFVGSCNGLICLSVNSKYKNIVYGYDGDQIGYKYSDEPSYVCNPITREYVNLPRVSIDEKKSKHGVYIVRGFGYYRPTNEYKVVRITYFGNTNYPPYKGKVEVYTLGSDSGWRSAGEVNYLLLSSFYSPSVCVDGALHWFQKGLSKIVVFDLGVEEFYLYPSPAGITGKAKLCVIKGFLCVLDICLCPDLWFLEKNEKTGSWRIVFSTQCIDNTTNILTITERDEIILGSLGKVILYNLKTRTSTVFADEKWIGRSWWLPHSHFNSFVSLNALGESSVMTFLD
ncbi:F-box protein At3g07870-like isoform X1 [Papaver somniferum]|nr:F-box protein At3g07870-like isoform X1 [Papaver somniferum]